MTIVVEVDADGNIIDSLQGDNGQIVQISETQKVGDNLFFASPYNMYLGRLDLSPPSMEVEGKGVRMKVEREDSEESSDDKGSKVEASDQQTTDGDEEESEHKTEIEVEEESKEKKVHEEIKSDFTKEEL